MRSRYAGALVVVVDPFDCQDMVEVLSEPLNIVRELRHRFAPRRPPAQDLNL
jgi:hypothetical protein